MIQQLHIGANDLRGFIFDTTEDLLDRDVCVRVCVCVCVRKSLMCFLNCLECRAASLAFKHSLNCNV